MLTHKCLAHVKQSPVCVAPGLTGGAHPAASIALQSTTDPVGGAWPTPCWGRGFQEVKPQTWSMLSCCV